MACFNLVVMGGFSYPRGMAGTRRVQNLIDALKEDPHFEVRVLLQRQSSRENALQGVHLGTPYRTVMGDLFRVRMLAALPLLWARTLTALREAFRPGCTNVIYFYGPLLVEGAYPLARAKKMGYRIVFDFVEDYHFAHGLSRSLVHQLRVGTARLLASRAAALADGIIVISSHLEERYRCATGNRVPLHYMPITVDLERFPGKPPEGQGVTLFYAGSFGKKDGLPVLLDAFDRLARSYPDLRLLLSGRGDADVMTAFFSRMERSPYRDRIDYRGYLEEAEYYALLNEADIPCMTRADLAFAHAGFPFKLGEFLATGRPVIASRVSDVDRVLIDRHNAMLVRPGSCEEIVLAVRFLIEHPEEAAAIGGRGREAARDAFDYRRQGREFAAFLENLDRSCEVTP